MLSTSIGTVIAESGGDFIYILRIYGQFPAFFAALTFNIVVKPASIAAISLSFAEYAVAPFFLGCHPPVLVLKCAAAASVLTVATINIMNVRFAMQIQVVFLVAKIVSLMIIVIGGVVSVGQSSKVITGNFHNSFEGTNMGFSFLGMAFYQGLWSFAGWYNLNYVTEELKKPEVRMLKVY